MNLIQKHWTLNLSLSCNLTTYKTQLKQEYILFTILHWIPSRWVLISNIVLRMIFLSIIIVVVSTVIITITIFLFPLKGSQVYLSEQWCISSDVFPFLRAVIIIPFLCVTLKGLGSNFVANFENFCWSKTVSPTWISSVSCPSSLISILLHFLSMLIPWSHNSIFLLVRNCYHLRHLRLDQSVKE